jgi:hypothetical protein
MTAATGLPEEVLERIFTEVRSYTNGIKTLLGLMVSCREFSVSSRVCLHVCLGSTTTQAVAERVMLRSVTVSSIAQLQSFERKLLAPSLQHRPDVRSGDLVRALVIHGNENALPDDPNANDFATKLEALTHWTTSIISTLAAVPMLKQAALHDMHTTRGHLSCLRLATQGRLTSLDITLSFTQGRSAGACAAINHFPQLEELRINLHGTAWRKSANASELESPLLLSNVKFFDVQGPSHSTGSFCDWVGHCRFHSSCSLRFNIMNPSHLSDTLRLCSFFDAHQFSTIELDVGNVVLQTLATRIASFKHVRLVGSNLPFELLRGPKCLPSHLIVDTQPDFAQTKDEGESDMWSFLSALPSGIEQEGRIIIQVDISEYQDPTCLFLWSDGGNIDIRHRAFIGQMVTEAARLYKHDIIIQDGEGRDIKHIVD